METAKVIFENDNTKIVINFKFDKANDNLDYSIEMNPHKEDEAMDLPAFLADMFLNSLKS